MFYTSLQTQMTKTYLAKVALALTLGCILIGTFSVKAFGFDADTKAYLSSLGETITKLEKTASPSDWKAQNAIIALRGEYEGIMIEYGNCPLKNSTVEVKRGYCTTWWILKMKPKHPNLYGFSKK